MAFDFHISTGSATPIFRQIVDQVRLAVATGQLPPGQPLPSVRALAQQLVLNPNTIAKAYTELSHEGLIDTRAGKGAVIAELREVYTEAERRRRLGPALEALVREAISLGFTPQQAQQLLQQQFKRLTGVPGRMEKP